MYNNNVTKTPDSERQGRECVEGLGLYVLGFPKIKS